MAEAIVIRGLTKKYSSYLGSDVLALDNLDLDVDEGEIFGFLGPNGAGKTTTIKILLGLLFATSGSASILGKPAGDIEVKQQISYLPESPYFYDYMTGAELLDFYASLFGISKDIRKKKVPELLDKVGLKKDADKPVRQYSKGMQQRIGLAQALINDPKLLFFDEPTSGLDPMAHKDISDLILSLKAEGKTVFLSSHQLADVELVCDRVAILNRGKLLRLGALEELLGGRMIEVIAEDVNGDGCEKLAKMGTGFMKDDNRVRVSAHDGSESNAIVDVVRTSGGNVVSILPLRQRLEDLFVETIREGNK